MQGNDMTTDAVPVQGNELAFGSFRFLAQQRLLYQANMPVRIGSRARELLVVLVERAGELVKKNELVARVWPGMIVEEATLRVHIAGLRKILQCGKDGARFIESVTGVGYRFVAPVVVARKSLAGMDDTALGVAPLREVQQLREENARLRRVVADLSLEKRVLEERTGQRLRGVPWVGALTSVAR
jgi:DNA-binding winged helix-turn-helix (wHTH) protein